MPLLHLGNPGGRDVVLNGEPRQWDRRTAARTFVPHDVTYGAEGRAVVAVRGRGHVPHARLDDLERRAPLLPLSTATCNRRAVPSAAVHVELALVMQDRMLLLRNSRKLTATPPYIIRGDTVHHLLVHHTVTHITNQNQIL